MEKSLKLYNLLNSEARFNKRRDCTIKRDNGEIGNGKNNKVLMNNYVRGYGTPSTCTSFIEDSPLPYQGSISDKGPGKCGLFQQDKW